MWKKKIAVLMSAAMLLSAFPANVFAGESVEMAALSEEAEETAEVTLVGSEASGETDGGTEVDGGTETGGSAEAQTAGQATGDVSGQEEQASQASGAAEDDSAVEEIVTPEIGAEEDEEEILIVDNEDTGETDGDVGSEIDSEESGEILLGEDEDAVGEEDAQAETEIETDTGLADVMSVESSTLVYLSGATYGDFTYGIIWPDEKQAIITKYNGSDTIVSVPDKIGVYEVTYIERNAFAHCTSITKVILPEGLVNIGALAFSGCTSLTEISIPQSVKIIDEFAFYNCASLIEVYYAGSKEEWTAITTGYDNEYIAEHINPKINIHYNSTGFTTDSSCTISVEETNSIAISATNMAVGIVTISCSEDDYSGTASVSSSNPEVFTLTSDEIVAFDGESTQFTISGNALTFGTTTITVTLSDGTSYSYDVAVDLLNSDIYTEGDFQYTVVEEKATIIKYTGTDTAVTVPEKLGGYTVTKIGNKAFGDCKNITSIILPDSITEIGDYAFDSCTALTNLNLPEGISSIGSEAFRKCTSLTALTLPESVITLGSYFIEGTGITSITILKGVTGSNNALGKATNLEEVIFEEGITEIPKGFFGSNTSVKYVMIPKTVEKIADSEFTTRSDDLAIYGYTGSYAQTYAKAHDITFVSIGDVDGFQYVSGESSAYTKEFWSQWLSTIKTTKDLLINGDNFLHVYYILQNDKSLFGKFEYGFTTIINLKDGWKELTMNEVSVEDTEDILYALLYEIDDSVEDLATKKTMQQMADLIQQTLTYEMTVNGFSEKEILKATEEMKSKDFKTQLTTGGIDLALEFLQEKMPDSAKDRMKTLLDTLDKSDSFKDGLQILGEGIGMAGTFLDMIEQWQNGFEVGTKLLKVQNANQYYLEMLAYLKDNGCTEVVKKAAKNLYDQTTKTIESAMVEYGSEVILDKVIDEVTDKIWFIKAAKEGVDLGGTLANKFFHTTDVANCKSTMRAAACIGLSMNEWINEKYSKAQVGGVDYDNAEDLLVSLILLSEVRQQGETAMSELAGYIGDSDAECLSNAMSANMETYKKNLASMKNEELQMFVAACPVSVEVLNSSGTVVLTVPDNQEVSGTQNGIHYKTYYSSITKDYMKVVQVPANSGYTYRLVGNAAGKVTCSVFDTGASGQLSSHTATNISISSGQNIVVTAAGDNSTYQVKQGTKVVESGSLTKTGSQTTTENNSGNSKGNTTKSCTHKWSKWKTKKKATVSAPAKQVRTCSKCKKSQTRNYGKKLTPKIKLTASSLTMKTRQSTTAFKAYGFANGDYLKKVTSSNTKILTVSNVKKTGTMKLTAQKKKGKVTLTLTMASGLTKKVTVNVQKKTVKTTAISGVQKSVTLKKGKTITLKPTLSPITSQQKITFKSSNKKVVTVTSKGVVKAVKKGTATITVKSGKKKVKCKITVK